MSRERRDLHVRSVREAIAAANSGRVHEEYTTPASHLAWACSQMAAALRAIEEDDALPEGARPQARDWQILAEAQNALLYRAAEGGWQPGPTMRAWEREVAAALSLLCERVTLVDHPDLPPAWVMELDA